MSHYITSTEFVKYRSSWVKNVYFLSSVILSEAKNLVVKSYFTNTEILRYAQDDSFLTV